ncbi:CBS domain-containing protein [Bacillus luteolus]|uniref:CBS domain-containing protein n=1 Tax=Litchfieldia luteola TaxID=682179 RepID=A0ABR9QLY1_9BACI|nr:cyclic di-AMP binding protein CbpA [Cytobacillus luteolus]MBE4909518.1 CBS domain-containing protein [Cytobacillus luteolus]MBP1940919.1 CBS domain-containing protein [Cytobacillus luteolus]
MKIRYNYVPKNEVKYCESTLTVKEAYEYLKETGYRSVPVLSEGGKKFEGLIYKVHLLDYLYEEKGSPEASIDSLVKNQDAFIYEEDSFFKTFLTIRRLPFIAVLNENEQFLGIITHANVMDVLEDSFGMKTGGYTLTIATIEHKGAIKDLVTLLRDINIDGMLTLDNGEKYLRRIIVNLPGELSPEKVKALVAKIEEKEFRVTHVDQIDK